MDRTTETVVARMSYSPPTDAPRDRSVRTDHDHAADKATTASAHPDIARTEITELLDAWCAGDAHSGEAALMLLYDELRRLARSAMDRESSGHTLAPTALVHEAWIRLMGSPPPVVRDRQHLLALSARLMRQLLVNHARDRAALKRGGTGRVRIPIDAAVQLWEDRCGDLVALHEALERLAAREPRQASIVELRFFGGLSMDEVAAALTVSRRTAEREWTMARAQLREDLAP